MATATEPISFARGVPAPDCLPEQELADCAREVLERDGKTILSYGSGAGYTPLRELIARVVQGAPAPGDPHERRAAGLRAARAALRPRADGARRVADLRPAAEDPARERPSRSSRCRWTTRASIPSAVEDTLPREPGRRRSSTRSRPSRTRAGARMPEDRRRQLVEHAQAAGTLIVEDDPYGLIRFEGELAAGDLRPRARDDDLHLVVLEDDLARASRRLVHRPGVARRPADRARELDLHHARPCSARRSCTSSSAAAASSRTSSASTSS